MKKIKEIGFVFVTREEFNNFKLKLKQQTGLDIQPFATDEKEFIVFFKEGVHFFDEQQLKVIESIAEEIQYPEKITEEYLLRNGFRTVDGCTSRYCRETSKKAIYITLPDWYEAYVDVAFPTAHGFKMVIRELPVYSPYHLHQICEICKIHIQWK